MEDLNSKNLSSKDYNFDKESEIKYLIYLISITMADAPIEKIEAVRRYLRKLGKDPLKLFDELWVRGDKKRVSVLQEMDMKEKAKHYHK